MAPVTPCKTPWLLPYYSFVCLVLTQINHEIQNPTIGHSTFEPWFGLVHRSKQLLYSESVRLLLIKPIGLPVGFFLAYMDPGGFGSIWKCVGRLGFALVETTPTPLAYHTQSTPAPTKPPPLPWQRTEAGVKEGMKRT